MSATTFAAIKMRLILFSNEAHEHVESITSYAGFIIHLLCCYDTDAVLASSGEKLVDLHKACWLTPGNVQQKL